MEPGMKVLLDDGAVILTVTSINNSDGSVVCSVDNSGELRSRAGVNLPNADTDLPAMSEKDMKDIKYGLEIDVDYVAASFIQTADGVREIRNFMKACAKELGVSDRPLPLIISKIESASALTNFDEILEESDGIMVARGGEFLKSWCEVARTPTNFFVFFVTFVMNTAVIYAHPFWLLRLPGTYIYATD